MDLSRGKYTRNEECWYHEVCQRDNSCESCIKYTEMSYLMENSNLPKAKQRILKLSVPKCDADAYKRLSEIKANIYDFVYEGKTLYIGSQYTGNGKTTWAIKMMHQYFDEVWEGNCLEPRALFINVPMFIIKSKDFDGKDENFIHMKKLIETVDLVVWDDIASTGMSAYDYNTLLAYIDYRCLSELANIYTGNFETKEDLAEILGTRLASRIWADGQEVVIFKNGDMR